MMFETFEELQTTRTLPRDARVSIWGVRLPVGVPHFSELIERFDYRKTALVSGFSRSCYLAQVGVTLQPGFPNFYVWHNRYGPVWISCGRSLNLRNQPT